MSNVILDSNGNLLPRPVSAIEIAEAREAEGPNWPLKLSTYSIFHVHRENEAKTYVALAWLPESNELWAQEISVGRSPPNSRLPIALHIDDRIRIMSATKRTQDEHIPEEMNTLPDKAPKSHLRGFVERTRLLHALLMVDASSCGDSTRYLTDRRIFTDPTYRSKRIREIAHVLNLNPESLRPKLLRLLTTHIWYCGKDEALYDRAWEKGGKGKTRESSTGKKPGPLSASEQVLAVDLESRGMEFGRQLRVSATDIADILSALNEHWVGGNKVSLNATFDEYLLKVKSRKKGTKPVSRNTFYREASRLIVLRDLQRARIGNRLTSQYGVARPGSSSDLTRGGLQIIDMDGWMPKVRIWGYINGRLVRLPQICVLIAVCRLSGAIVGYEIELKHESAESYRKCALSVLSNKRQRARELGITTGLTALVAGGFDGVFVDNGPGGAKKVRKSFIGCEIAGVKFLSPPRRGDLKGLIESLNFRFARLLVESTRAAFTRERKPLERERLRKAAREKQLTIVEFERFMLEAIIHLNRTRDCSSLRDRIMYEKGVTIFPYSIHNYLQRERRRGDAARVRTDSELLDALIPWEPVQCIDATVRHKNVYFTSTELETHANSLAPSHRRSFPVEAKITGPGAGTILCRTQDRTVYELTMTDQCSAQYGNASWKEIEHVRLDVSASQQQEEKMKAVTRPRGSRSNRLTDRQQGILDRAEQAKGNKMASATKRSSSATEPDLASEWSSGNLAQHQRDTYGPATSADTSKPASNSPKMSTADDDPIAKAAKAAEAESRAEWKKASNHPGEN